MTAAFDPDWLRPAWDAPSAAGVMTTRRGGVSAPPFDSLNIRFGIGDHAADVLQNRRRVADAISADAGAPVQPVYLDQVHGTRVVRLTAADGAAAAAAPLRLTADACITTEHGIACTAQVADCLPVLFAAPGGVGAAHAGWRGLSAGVLEATLTALCDAVGCRPAAVHVWLGAGIGPGRFEVGSDVLQAFGAGRPAADPAVRAAFRPHRASPGSPKWLADLPALARARLLAAGVEAISGGGWCTVDDASRFFSYRRDGGVTGRMVAAVWRRRIADGR